MDIQKYGNHEKGLSTAGVNPEYHDAIKAFNVYLNGQLLTPESIKDYFFSLKKSAPATIRKHKAALKAALLSAAGPAVRDIDRAQLDMIFKGIKVPAGPSYIEPSKVLTPDELQALIELAPLKTALIIRALYITAARVSELCTITLDACEVRGDAVILSIIGKGGKPGRVYMPIELFNEIRAAWNGTQYLFEAPGGGPLSRLTVYTMLKRAGKKIDRADIHPHTLRHTWGSNNIMRLGLSKVSGYLRHADTATTARFYIHGQASIDEILDSGN